MKGRCIAAALARSSRLRAATPGDEGAPALGYAWAAQSAAGGSGACGASHLVREVSPGRLLVAISDGMSVGRHTADQSALALRLLERLAASGIDHGAVVAAVNSALLLRSLGETFATLDIALLDLVAARAEFLKVGAPACFLRRGSHVDEIAAPSLPAGLLERVEMARSTSPAG